MTGDKRFWIVFFGVSIVVNVVIRAAERIIW